MFWITVIALGALASLFIIVPLFSRQSVREQAAMADQSKVRDDLNLALYQERVDELRAASPDDVERLELDAQKDLLSDTRLSADFQTRLGNNKLLIVIAVLLPLFALFIYSDAGVGRGAIADFELALSLNDLDPTDKENYQAFAQRVEARLAQDPDDSDLQFLMASAYGNLGRFEDAAALYEKLVATFPDDPSLVSRYAEVLFVADERRFTERSTVAVEQALRLNPLDTTMLEIMAIGAIGQGDLEAAMTWFSRALQSGVTGRRAELIRLAMTRLQSQGLAAPANDDALVDQSQGQAQGRVITVNVTLDDSVKVPPTAVVFVYARAAQGSPAPLAVQRLLPSALPATVTLDENMAMMPGMGLANFDEVVVIARVSLTGQVAPKAGDFEARTQAIDLTQTVEPLTLIIAEAIVPSGG